MPHLHITETSVFFDGKSSGLPIIQREYRVAVSVEGKAIINQFTMLLNGYSKECLHERFTEEKEEVHYHYDVHIFRYTQAEEFKKAIVKSSGPNRKFDPRTSSQLEMFHVALLDRMGEHGWKLISYFKNQFETEKEFPTREWTFERPKEQKKQNFNQNTENHLQGKKSHQNTKEHKA